MAKEIKVTFEDGGVYEGFANTYTLDNTITYYFSFDRDYRVQLTNNAITLQEYRNAGAWYPIDIITAFEVSEISGGSGSGDVTKEWVQDNFVLKSGDTMTGALKFDFGNGVVFRIEPDSTAKRVDVTGNGGFYWENDNKKRTFSILASTDIATMNFYNVNNKYSRIWFRDYEFGSSGNYRGFNYLNIYNSDTNNAWLMNGKFQTNNDWFFKGNGYIDANFYARLTAQSDLIGVVLNGNGLQLYSDKNITIHKYEKGASNQYYTSYKTDGRNTVSTVGGQEPRYRITGYNNFVDSIECYDKITIKTEGENTARLILAKGYLYIYDSNNKVQYQLSPSRFDIYNGHAVICHEGAGGTDAQATFQYNGVRTYNYNGVLFTVNITDGYYSNYSKRFDVTGNYVSILAKNDSMNITAPKANVIISDSQGVYGRSSNTEVNTYIRNVSHNLIVQTSQTAASDARRDELTALLDLFKIVYNILEAAGIPGASQLAEYTSDTVLWIYDNKNGVLKPTITKIRNLIHN